jgi:hypothetical protein
LLAASPANATRSRAERPLQEHTLRRRYAGGSGTYQHYFTGLALGRGVRFNNPYRLATPLGDSYESLSLSATTVSLTVGATFGTPGELEHGASLALDYALDGIRQEVLTPSYVSTYALVPRWRVYGRAGTPLVLEPDLNVGLELGAGAVYQFLAGLGASVELIGSAFYGAATVERSATFVPLVSLQLGVRADYEVLP